MDMHVPQTGNQKLAGSIYYLKVSGKLGLTTLPHPNDSPAVNQYGHLGFYCAGFWINYCDVSNCDWLPAVI